MMELSAPRGILMSELRNPPKDVTRNYVNSKTGNYLLSAELARRQRQKGQQSVVSVALNPGAARTDLFRHHPWMNYAAWPLLYPARMAALTQLYAGLSGDIGVEQSGCYVMPWGWVATLQRKDLVDAVKGTKDYY
jgi:NAD(P)-dependent dehydrogenase (short-subunit alcohol dehydrogenase family)